MFMRLLALSAIIVVSGVFARQPATPPAVGYKDSYQLNVFASSTGSFVELTNAGFHKTISLAQDGLPARDVEHGNICVNVYVFRPDESLCSCCALAISQNSYTQLPVSLLASCPVFGRGTGVAPGITRIDNGTVKLVATTPTNPNATGCDPSQVQVGTLRSVLSSSLRKKGSGGPQTAQN
jgi:hypothetical protein